MATARTRNPRASLIGFASIGWGIALVLFAVAKLFASEPLPMPLTVALGAAGGLEIVLGLGLLGMSRVAWSFALSLDGVGGLVALLAAPKMARAGWPLPIALVPAFLLIALTTLLTMTGEEYK